MTAVPAGLRASASEAARPYPPKRPPLRIGEWRIERSLNELHRAGRAVRVEPKAMEVLGMLAERAGEVVGREELLAAVWPGVIVGDDALTQTIIKLRKALGDTPRSPSYIETISKRGYRLIAPVAAGDDIAAARAGEGSARRDSANSARPGLRWLGAAALTVVALAATALHFRDSPRTVAATRAGSNAAGIDDADSASRVTVTVLPFETLDAGTAQAYLARGIGSDLMTDLSRLSELSVISASAGGAGGRDRAGARYAVFGSIQREGSTLRVNVRLTDSRTGEQVWSRRFERPIGDLLAIQNEITRDLVEQLPGRISDAERRQLAKRYTTSPEAYDAFLRAKALFLVRRPDENEGARALYMKALDLDPQFARAYAGLAMTYAMDYRYRGAGESTALARALDLAETARMIDPDIPEVHWALGFIHAQARRYEPAIASLRRAIELNRSYADAYALLGGIYTYMGQSRRSIPLLRTALRLHPDGGYLYFLLLGRAYFFEDDIGQALINLREALKRNPADLETHVYLAAALVADGDRAAAEWEANEIRSREAHFSMAGWLESYPLADPPYRRRLLELASKAGL